MDLLEYYHGMWEKRLRMLETLTNLTSSRVKFKWTYIEQNTFNDIERVVERYTLLGFPYFDKWFGINIDARDFQIGVVSIQYGEKNTF